MQQHIKILFDKKLQLTKSKGYFDTLDYLKHIFFITIRPTRAWDFHIKLKGSCYNMTFKYMNYLCHILYMERIFNE